MLAVEIIMLLTVLYALKTMDLRGATENVNGIIELPRALIKELRFFNLLFQCLILI
jgi:hypothetical protein